MFKTIFQNFKEKFTEKIQLQKVSFSDCKVVDKNCCYVTTVTFHDSKISKIK